MAGRVGILKVMILGGERAWFDAVVLNAYKECPAQDREDRRRYPRRRRRFRRSLRFDLPPRPPNAYSPELVQFVQRSQTVQVPSSTRPSPSPFRLCASLLPFPTLHHFVRAPPHLRLRLKDGSTIRSISRRNCIILGPSKTTSVAYVLDVRRRVRSCLSRFNIRSPRRGLQLFILKHNRRRSRSMTAS